MIHHHRSAKKPTEANAKTMKTSIIQAVANTTASITTRTKNIILHESKGETKLWKKKKGKALEQFARISGPLSSI